FRVSSEKRRQSREANAHNSKYEQRFTQAQVRFRMDYHDRREPKYQVDSDKNIALPVRELAEARGWFPEGIGLTSLHKGLSLTEYVPATLLVQRHFAYQRMRRPSAAREELGLSPLVQADRDKPC